ncbi:hypothetical protein PGT21_027630 [Puccinia graminis f. sp. tritici]|uniref:Uncharacterized protein n=1 Tax=Puccinia graminis f. sp. tritici TaxID=56615 RepID=A0A5B0MGU2_PUCGR|nr:hypothetical protein PGT21_027630 [Puccinia graminis f. sp. tritici]
MKSLPVLGTSIWAFFQLIQPIVLVNGPTHSLTRKFEDVGAPVEMAAENERAAKRQRLGSDEQTGNVSERDTSAPDDQKFKDYPDCKPIQPDLAATGSAVDLPGPVQTEQNKSIDRLPTLNPQTPQITSDVFEISRDHPYVGGLGPIPESFNVDKIPFFESKYPEVCTLSDLTEWLPNFRKTKAKANLNSGEDLNYLPVVMLPFSGRSVHVHDPISNLRIVNQNNFYQGYEKIKQLVGNLRNWLFSHHYRLSKRLGLSDDARVQDRRYLHEWFRQGLFKPLGCLPATGNVNCAARKKGFGLFQRWVIWYLYSEDLERTASITAVALNGLWWKDVSKAHWRMIMEANDCFWSFVSTPVPELDQKGPGVRFPPFEPKKPASQLPHLGMMDMKDLPLRDAFQFTNLIIKTPAPSRPILKLEKAIVDRIDEIYGTVEEVNKEGSAPSSAATRFFEMRAILEPAVERDTNELGFTIRLIDERGEKIPLETIEERMEDLLESFRWWHENLQLGLLEAGIQPKPNAHQLFLKWLKSILFGKKNSVPVFGFIDLSDGMMISQGPPGFGKIQRFVIHRLATDPSVKIIMEERESGFEVPATSATDEMAVLSHWYHLYFGNFWRDYLQNKTKLMEFFKNGLASRNGLPFIAKF